MAASVSQSAQVGVSEDDDQHHTQMETKTVEEKEPKNSEGVIVKLQRSYPQKRPWSIPEDAKLVMLVAVHGEKTWAKISRKLPGRSFADCRVRWADNLTPCVKGSPFNNEEELHLLVAHARGIKLKSSAAAAAACRTTDMFTYPERSTVIPCTTPSGSGKDLTWNSTYNCIACTFNWHSPVHGQRAFMADCGMCRKALAMGGRKVNAEARAASIGNVHQSRPPVFPFVRVNPISQLATTTAYRPILPPLPPPPPPPPPPPSPPSSPRRRRPKFIDFLGVGSE